MIEAKGRYLRRDGKMYIYVPSALVLDSKFPLEGKSGVVKIRVEAKHLIVETA